MGLCTGSGVWSGIYFLDIAALTGNIFSKQKNSIYSRLVQGESCDFENSMLEYFKAKKEGLDVSNCTERSPHFVKLRKRIKDVIENYEKEWRESFSRKSLRRDIEALVVSFL